MKLLEKPAQKQRSLARRRLFIAAAVAAAILLAGAAALWLARADIGRWAVRHAQFITGGAVQIDTPQGDPWSTFSAKSLTIKTSGADIHVTNLRWTLHNWSWEQRKIHFALLAADQVKIRPRPSADPARVPTSLALPYELTLLIDQLQAQQVLVEDQSIAPFQSVSAQLALTPAQHRVNVFQALWDEMQLSGMASVGTSGTLPTLAKVAAIRSATQAIPEVQIALELQGPLARLQAGAALRAQNQRLDVSAVLEPWADNPLPGLDARFADLDLRALLSTLPQTALRGTAKLTRAAGQPTQIQLAATNTAHGRWDAGRLPVADLNMRGSGRQRDWNIESFDANLSSGKVNGRGQISSAPWSVNFTAQSIQLQALDSRLPSAFAGGQAQISGSAVNQALRFDSTINLQPQSVPKVRALPPATVQLRGSFLSEQQVVLDTFDLQSGGARMRGSARAQASNTPASIWQVQADTTIENFTQQSLQLFFPSIQQPITAKTKPVQDTPPTPSFRINSTVNLSFSVDRRRSQLLTDGKAAFELRNSMLQNEPLGGKGTASLTPTGAAADSPSRLLPQTLRNQRISGEGSIQWGTQETTWQGAFGQPGDRLAWRLALPDLQRLSPLTNWLRLPAVPAAGIQAQGILTSGVRDATIDAAGTAKALKFKSARAEQAQFQINASTALTAPLLVKLELSEVTGLLPGKNLVQKLSFNASGSLAQHRATLVGNGVQNQRAIRIDSAVTGTLQAATNKSGSWQWRGQIERADVLRAPVQQGASAAQLAVEPLLRASGLTAQIETSGDDIMATLLPGTAEIMAVPVTWQRAQFNTESSDGRGRLLDLQGTVGVLDIATLKRVIQTPSPLLEQWEGDLTLAGRFSVQATDGLKADVRLERTGGDLRLRDGNNGEALGLTQLRAVLAVQDGLWQLEHEIAGRSIGTLRLTLAAQAQPAALLPPDTAPLSGKLTAQVENVAAWSVFMPTGWRLGGRVSGEALLSGTLGEPVASGRLQAEQITLRNPLEGIDVKNGTGAVVFTERTVTLENARAQAGEGTIAASGSATLGARQTLQLQLQADRFGLLNRVDRQVTVSGNANARIEQNRLQIAGNVRIDNGLIDVSRQDAPSLSDDVVVRRAQSGTITPTASSGERITTALDLTVNAGNALRLRGRGIDTLLRGELKITTPGGRLAAQGQLLTELGTYAAYRQRLEIERGIIRYPSAVPGNIGNPQLEVLALRPNIDQRVGVSITGTAMAPRVKLYSEPEMPDNEKLAWLVLGRGFEGASRDDTKLVQEAALALLAGEKGGVTGQLQEAIGLDTFSVGSRTGSDSVNETVVSLGKQISRRVYLGYERGLNSTTGAWQLIYRLTNRFTLRAQSGTDPSVDMIWTWRFD